MSRAMSKISEAAFLTGLADLFEAYPDVRLFYTIDDDGVYAALNSRNINLGFSADTLVKAAREHAAHLTKRKKP